MSREVLIARDKGELAVTDFLPPRNQANQDAYHGTPVDVRQLDQERGDKTNMIDGYLQLAETCQDTQFHKSAPELAVRMQKAPLTFAITGRIAEFNIPTVPGTGGGFKSQEQYAAINTMWSSGSNLRSARAILAENGLLNRNDKNKAHQYDVTANAGAIYGIFIEDVDSHHPLEHVAPMYKTMHEWRQADVLAKDAFAENYFVDSTFDGEAKPRQAFMTEANSMYQADLTKRFGGEKGLAKRLDQVIAGVGLMYTTLEKLDPKSGDEVSYEELRDKIFKHSSIRVKDLLKEHLGQSGDQLFSLRSYLHAWEGMNSIRQFEATHKNLSAGDKRDIEEKRGNIRKELIQSITIPRDVNTIARQGAYQLDEEGNPDPIHPVKFKIFTIDALDVKFARALGNINAGNYAKQAQVLARTVGKRKLGTSLIIQPIGKTQIKEYRTLRPGEGGDDGETVDQIHKVDGDVMQFVAQQGATPGQMVRGMYDLSQEPIVDGMVTMFEISDPDMQVARRFMVMDYNRAPACLLDYNINNTQTFTSSGKEQTRQPYLIEMFLAAGEKPPMIAVGKVEQKKGLNIGHVLLEGMGVEFVRNEHPREDQPEIEVRGVEPISYVEAAKLSHSKIHREDRILAQERFVMARDKGLGSGEVSLAGVAVKNNAHHVAAGKKTDGSAEVLVMRSERREYE